jgi:hypothetical protein
MKRSWWQTVRAWPFKEVVVVYLAVSKVMYWVTVASGWQADDLDSVWHALLVRLLNRDLMLFLSVVLLFILEAVVHRRQHAPSLARDAVMYLMGYVGIVGVFYGYLWIWSFHAHVVFPPFGQSIRYSALTYFGAVLVVEFKERWKKKEVTEKADHAIATGTASKKSMLRALNDAGILSDTEYLAKTRLAEALGHE